MAEPAAGADGRQQSYDDSLNAITLNNLGAHGNRFFRNATNDEDEEMVSEISEDEEALSVQK